MKERKELSLEDKVAFGEKNVDELVLLLKKGLDNFKFSETVEVENRGKEDLSISILGYGLSIDLIEMERESIVRTIVVPAWQLTGWKFYAASQWEPEDVVEIPISEHRSYWGAVAAAIKAIFSSEVDNWFEYAEESTRIDFEMVTKMGASL
jgi:hypothetical protein